MNEECQHDGLRGAARYDSPLHAYLVCSTVLPFSATLARQSEWAGKAVGQRSSLMPGSAVGLGWQCHQHTWYAEVHGGSLHLRAKEEAAI